MQVLVVNRQRKFPVDRGKIKNFAKYIFAELDVECEAFFEISFVAPERMKSLNAALLGHNYVTDVISLRYAEATELSSSAIVGEVLIAPSQADAYSRENGIEYSKELLRYVAHGILHWNGMSDASEVQREKMRLEENRLLEAFFKKT